MAGEIGTGGRVALGTRDRERLRARAAEAVRRARRRGRALATITVALPAGSDPTAIAAASRRTGEAWFSFEQPDR
ncbi:MAG TPA: isochorismate synthase, partial [Solirubrobacteraceae bacterium]|nr:isochorismate synthase [Solirubrobacteraceae bacterium]